MITDQHIEIITNLSTPVEGNPIFQKMLKKSGAHFNISLEQTGDKFEHVRDGAKWNVILDNIEVLRKHDKSFSFHMVYCIYSASDLYSVLKYLTSMANVIINPLWTPEHLNILNHNKNIKQLCLNEIEKILDDDELCKSLTEQIEVLKSLRTQINDSPDIDMSETFKREQGKNPNFSKFAELWPELWQNLN